MFAGTGDGARCGTAVSERRSPIAWPGVLETRRRAAGLGGVMTQGGLGDDVVK